MAGVIPKQEVRAYQWTLNLTTITDHQLEHQLDHQPDYQELIIRTEMCSASEACPSDTSGVKPLSKTDRENQATRKGTGP